MKMNKYTGQGFTLIEAMVVMAIIGIMAAAIMPRFLNTADDSYLKLAPNQIMSELFVKIQSVSTNNAAPGCTNVNTASLTAANNNTAFRNIFDLPVTVTAATLRSVTVQYPTPSALNATSVDSKIPPGGFNTVVAGVNINITYPCTS